MTAKAQHKKRPRDANQLAKHVVDLATGGIAENEGIETACDKDPAAVSLGRRGGLKGGKARAKKLSAEQRSQIARLAARARYDKQK